MEDNNNLPVDLRHKEVSKNLLVVMLRKEETSQVMEDNSNLPADLRHKEEINQALEDNREVNNSNLQVDLLHKKDTNNLLMDLVSRQPQNSLPMGLVLKQVVSKVTVDLKEVSNLASNL